MIKSIHRHSKKAWLFFSLRIRNVVDGSTATVHNLTQGESGLNTISEAGEDKKYCYRKQICSPYT